MAERPTLIVLHGGEASGPASAALLRARLASGLDLLERAPRSAFSRLVLATDRAPEGWQLPPDLTIDIDDGPFHFGRRLLGLVERYATDSVLYMSAGSAPLLSAGSLAAIAGQLSREPALVANNLYSSDLAGWAPAQAIRRVEMPESDNILARRLRDAGLPARELERTAETQFDIDAPGDLALLSLAGDLGPRLEAEIDELAPDTSGLECLLPLLCDRSAEIVVAGRVGSETWRYLETETACRVRVFSEERGLRAAGREESGARSLLADLLQRVGPREFFAVMATLGQALLLDTRVIFSHLGWRPSAEDRFQSDLLAVERIEHPELRAFTQAAREAAIPVVLGGHSLVSGGLLLLTDVAWRRHDARL